MATKVMSHIQRVVYTCRYYRPDLHTSLSQWQRTVPLLTSSSATTKDSRYSTATHTGFRYPLDRHSEIMVYGNDIGASLTNGLYRFNTAEPLQEEDVKKALVLLKRKVPILRAAIKKEEDGHFWLEETHDDCIDFQVLKGPDIEKEQKSLTNAPFSHDSQPLWKTRLSEADPDSPCSIPGLKDKFPHQYDFIFHPHHAIVGGPTMVIISQTLIEILNKVIGKEDVDTEEQIGKAVSGEHIEYLKRHIKNDLRASPDEVVRIKEELLACDSSPILFRAFPPPGGEPESRHIHRSIETDLYKRFKVNCKKAGVTFSTGVEAVINTAIMELVRDAGVDVDSHDISVFLFTDLRRYMDHNPLGVLGFHILPTVHCIRTPCSARDHFWQYSQRLQQKLIPLIKANGALKQEIVREMTLPVVPPKDYFTGILEVVRDYNLVNLGNLTNLMPGEGPHLQLSHVSQFSSVHKSPFMMMHQLHTFRGSCPYNLSYDASYMTEQTANLLLDKIFSILTFVNE